MARKEMWNHEWSVGIGSQLFQVIPSSYCGPNEYKPGGGTETKTRSTGQQQKRRAEKEQKGNEKKRGLERRGKRKKKGRG